ncbi:MAG: glycosyltransferase [Parcubacteria group bacterium Gr01-1014_31]|nr:MAG: glycosyltransferase [Parcubacteria group bacterium Gr01-1014_31]
MARVTIIVVTWNSAAVLPECLAALRQQEFKDFVVQVVDNASTDETIAIVREFYPEARILTNFRNTGFSRANNQGIALAQGDYVLVHNPDVALVPSCLARLVTFADAHPQAGSFCPKLLRRPEGEELQEPALGEGVLDAVGLRMTRSRAARNRGEGERDAGQYAFEEEVFGASGACALYRRTALAVVAKHGGFFDESFFAYKEDVDLAWRFQQMGISCWYVPSAVGYHRRTFRRRGGFRHFAHLPVNVRLMSWRNYLSLLIKNERWQNFWRDAHRIVPRALAALLLLAVMEPFRWRTLRDWRAQWPQLLRARRSLVAGAGRSPQELRRWFGRPRLRQ